MNQPPMSIDSRITKLGLELPPPFPPAISALASLHAELGSLDRVRRIVSLRGVVNAAPSFTGHTQVIDAASEVFIELFGDRGRHARLAVGVSSLPANLALEIELLVEIDHDAR